MKRRALIVYCGEDLKGPPKDCDNFFDFLSRPIGGAWETSEILPLSNPTKKQLISEGQAFINDGMDYTFVVFTGHGFINKDDNYKQYIGLKDGWVSADLLVSNAPRQTLIMDACREHISLRGILKEASTPSQEQFSEGFGVLCRELYDDAIAKAPKGLSVLYAAGDNETALDTPAGAAYLLSLLDSAYIWEKTNKSDNILSLKNAHQASILILRNRYGERTTQNPCMNAEKRNLYFPFAVKPTLDNISFDSFDFDL